MPGSYDVAWRDYRIRRWAVAGCVIIMIGVSCFRLDPSRDTLAGQIFWWVAFAVLVIFIVRWRTWPCPRCGRTFLPFARMGGYGRNRCDHCGLPMWCPTDPDPDALSPRW